MMSNGFKVMMAIKRLCLLTMVLSFLPMAAFANPDLPTYRQWIVDMKERNRGPFKQLRWFCTDGSILAPEPYACSDHGGGTQHGEWTKKVKTLRQQGYFIATLLADESEQLLRSPDQAEPFRQLLIERYLRTVDDGWIMRKSRFYRGSMQAEDEIRGARNILQNLVRSKDWLVEGYITLRAGVQALPHGVDSPSVLKMRQMAIDLSSADKRFMPLRNKIHISPDASDAVTVRNYAAKLSQSKAKKYHRLADLIDEIYARPDLNKPISRLSKRVRKMPNMSRSLRDISARLISTNDAEVLFETTANTMMVLRHNLADVSKAGVRLDVLDTSILLEAEHFDLGRELIEGLDTATRAQRLRWLRSSLKAAYGSGVLSRRQLDSLNDSLDQLAGEEVDLLTYKKQLDYLARVPAWASQNLRHHFYSALTKLAEIEPLAELFIQDQLRGGPLLFYVDVIDSLMRDANQLVGIKSQLFGEEIGSGLRGLNPGLAQGVLHLTRQADKKRPLDRKGIYLLSETVTDLPPVAGIITAGEGNPLSHVQLLARNLGIPNVSIDQALIKKLRPYDNKWVTLAVSVRGTIHLFEGKGDKQSSLQDKTPVADLQIKADMNKIDLVDLSFIPLSKLRSDESGVRVGPKAANLGELKHHFPEAVAEGLAIPFAVFKQLLQQPMPGAGKSVFYWMVDQYQALDQLAEGSDQRKQAEAEFRQALSNWVKTANPGRSFRLRLKRDMDKIFGADGSYGVFVRSDTNVEDLPNFTGAGLNLTVANVIGLENIFEAISKVWASPFSERAFAWRQSHMEQPQHVYPAVLLMRSVAVEKSGVMVTRDIENGERGWLSIAVNEGVGGAVDGQAAESLKVNVSSGEVILLAQATSSNKRVISKQGGVDKVAVSGAERILSKDEIQQLIVLSRQIPKKFPKIIDKSGQPAAADVEFGFLNGKLQLFQIRPFLESEEASRNDYLSTMDTGLKKSNRQINLTEVPG